MNSFYKSSSAMLAATVGTARVGQQTIQMIRQDVQTNRVRLIYRSLILLKTAATTALAYGSIVDADTVVTIATLLNTAAPLFTRLASQGAEPSPPLSGITIAIEHSDDR